LRKFLLGVLLLAQTGCTSYLVVSGGEVRQDKLQEIRRGLTTLRGLSFKAEVPVEVKGNEAIKEYLEASLIRDYPEEKLENLSLAYAELGLLPRGLDLKKALLDFYGSQVVAFYDPQAKKLFLPNKLAGGGAVSALQFLAQRDIMGEMVLAHELTHALQDQHFSVGKLLEESSNNDRNLALRCLIEGDALLAGFGYLVGYLDEENTQRVSQEIQNSMGQARSNLSADIPEAVLEQLLFQYYGGVSFVSQFFNERGWLGIDRIYSNPPLSTEQVLHPEKYIDDPDPPTRIELGDLASFFPLGWQEIENNTLGELMVRVLFERFLSREKGRAGAMGWDGDRFVAFRRGKKVSYIWATVWDSAAEAEEFVRTYREIGSIKQDKSGADGSGAYIERRGLQAIIVEGLESSHIRKHIEKIWLGLKLEETPFQRPFTPILRHPVNPS